MKYIGWVLFGWGILIYVIYTIQWLEFGNNRKVIEKINEGNKQEKTETYGTLLVSIFTIGVGSYIIKNFP